MLRTRGCVAGRAPSNRSVERPLTAANRDPLSPEHPGPVHPGCLWMTDAGSAMQVRHDRRRLPSWNEGRTTHLRRCNRTMIDDRQGTPMTAAARPHRHRTLLAYAVAPVALAAAGCVHGRRPGPDASRLPRATSAVTQLRCSHDRPPPRPPRAPPQRSTPSSPRSPPPPDPKHRPARGLRPVLHGAGQPVIHKGDPSPPGRSLCMLPASICTELEQVRPRNCETRGTIIDGDST